MLHSQKRHLWLLRPVTVNKNQQHLIAQGYQLKTHWPKLILPPIVLTVSRRPSPWVSKAVLTLPRVLVHKDFLIGQTVRHRDGGKMVQIYQWWHVFQHLTVLTSHVQVAWSDSSKMWKQWHIMLVLLRVLNMARFHWVPVTTRKCENNGI